jgi:hypothetical protein
VLRDTPSVSASARVPGSRVPAGIAPPRIASRTRRSSWRCNDGAPAVRASGVEQQRGRVVGRNVGRHRISRHRGIAGRTTAKQHAWHHKFA